MKPKRSLETLKIECYDHGGGRIYFDDGRNRELVADLYHEEDREVVYSALKKLVSFNVERECRTCGFDSTRGFDGPEGCKNPGECVSTAEVKFSGWVPREEWTMADQVSREESGGLKYAKAEFARLHRLYDWEEPDMRPIAFEYEEEILALVDKFGKSGQSGGSAPSTAGAILYTLKNLFRHHPITPIEDLPEDWNKLEYDDRTAYQHKRCSAVFKDAKGRAYYLDGVVFQGEETSDTFTSNNVDGVASRQFIKSWPFEPRTFIVHVKRERNDDHPDRVICGDGDYLYHLADPTELDAVWEYYERPVDTKPEEPRP